MKLAYRLILLLLLLQVSATLTLYTLDPTGSSSQAVFATLLGADLLAFALVSYLYRSEKTGTPFSRVWFLTGCAAFVILFLAVLLRT